MQVGLASAGFLACLHSVMASTEEAITNTKRAASTTQTAAPLGENKALLNRQPVLLAEGSTGMGWMLPLLHAACAHSAVIMPACVGNVQTQDVSSEHIPMLPENAGRNNVVDMHVTAMVLDIAQICSIALVVGGDRACCRCCSNWTSAECAVQCTKSSQTQQTARAWHTLCHVCASGNLHRFPLVSSMAL